MLGRGSLVLGRDPCVFKKALVYLCLVGEMSGGFFCCDWGCLMFLEMFLIKFFF